ncbi:MAG: ATP-binding protein [Flavobacteriales bacterium]
MHCSLLPLLQADTDGVARAPWSVWVVFAFAAILAGIVFALVARWLWRRDNKIMLLLRRQTALDKERRRIASDVHDDLGAEISLVLGMARSAGTRAESEGERHRMRSIASGLSGVIDKIDEIIWTLDPKRDNLVATMDYIERWLTAFADGHGLAFRSEIVHPKKRVYLAADQRRGLLLMIKELARNVAEHAGAQQVKVTSAVAYGHLYITVSDDGQGMIEGPAQDEERHGLKGLRARAAKLEGSILHEPNEPRGTKVRIDLPLPGHHK